MVSPPDGWVSLVSLWKLVSLLLNNFLKNLTIFYLFRFELPLTWVKISIFFHQRSQQGVDYELTIHRNRSIHLDLHQVIKLTYRSENKRYSLKIQKTRSGKREAEQAPHDRIISPVDDCY
jgi:hypothetical protein